jgi:hypothetical protein
MEDDKNKISHYQIVANRQRQKEAKDAKYRDKSKKRLSNIITTKIKTSFIGAISSCEKNFGFLWGHGKDEDSLTEEEISMRELWEEIRTEILDNGNTQLRAATNEIENYSINWERYSINLNINEE